MVTITATVTGSGSTKPTGTVVFSNGATSLGSATLVSGVATLATSSLTAGTHSIAASYAGDANFSASNTTLSVVVNTAGGSSPGGTTTTTLSAAPNPGVVGQLVTFTATILISGSPATSATGAVIFSDGSTSLGSAAVVGGVATFATSSLSAGTHSIKASYRGDANFSSSSSSALSFVVNKSSGATASSTTLTATPNPGTVGQLETFTARVSAAGKPATSATGTMTFSDGTTTLGNAPVLSGVATYATSGLSAATHSIKASYGGDGAFASSAATIQLAIAASSGPTQTTAMITLTASPNPALVGQVVTLSATVTGSAPTGSVTFVSDQVAVCNNVALSGSGNDRTSVCTTSNLTAGSHSVTASYSGDDANTAASSAPLTLGVNAVATGGGTSVNLDQFGLTGSWYDSATSGQGLLVQVLPDITSQGHGVLFAGWFTYDVAPAGDAEKQRWYTLQGNISNTDTAAALGIFANTGGNFGAPPQTSAIQVGSATLQVSDCQHASLSYNFTDGSGRAGTIALTRLDTNVTCTSTGRPLISSNYLLSGGWYDADTSGQGLVFDINPNEQILFAAWYTFAPNGEAIGGGASQRWYTLQTGGFPEGTVSKNQIPIYASTGGIFNTPNLPTTVQVGVANVSFQSCVAATLTYAFSSGTNAGRSGTIRLQRAGSPPNGSACSD